MDILLLKILKERKNYDAIAPNIPKEALDPKTIKIIEVFGKFFKETETDYIDIEEFKGYFFLFCNKDSTSVRAYYSRILNNCMERADPKTVECIRTNMVELQFATRVANLLQQYNSNNDVNILKQTNKELEDAANKLITAEKKDLHITTPIEDIVKDDENTVGLQFALPVLRNNLRPLQAGDFVIAAGRVDVGKTTFLTSQLHSLNDGIPDNRPILWFNNEGRGNRILKRIYQSALKATTLDLIGQARSNTLRDNFRDTYKGYNPIRVIDCHDWDSAQVEDAIVMYNPGLVIFDMIDNIKFPINSTHARTDQVLEAMYQWARVLGVKHDTPIIATSQVSAEAELLNSTSMYPEQHMLKDSKTGKQGAADVIITIGKNKQEGLEDIRYIATPKNKLATGYGIIKEAVKFDKLRAQYT